MKVRIPGEYDADAVSVETALFCSEETLTRQSFAEECDINVIVARFGIGEHPVDSRRWITDVDVVDAASDYHSALNMIIEAREAFMELPARVRARFGNDPGNFVAFCSDERNAEEMVSLGLAERRPVPGPLASVEPEPLVGGPVGVHSSSS